MNRDERVWREVTLHRVQAMQQDLRNTEAEKSLSSRLLCEASAIDLYLYEVRQRMDEVEKLLTNLGRLPPTEDE